MEPDSQLNQPEDESTESTRVEHTSTPTRRAFLQVAGAASVFGIAQPAAATPDEAGKPLSGSGTGRITNLVPTPVREVGGNRFEDRILTGTVTGTLEGTFEQHVSGMVHKSGRVVFDGTMTFDGQVGDCGTGTLTLGVTGRGQIEPPGIPITEASVRVIEQATNTVDITGMGTVSQEGANLTYEIQYKCV